MAAPRNRRENLARGLTGLLADTYVLYNTTQFYHWNVEGPHFHALHTLFEDQYTELAGAVDMLAERIRSLGFYAPGTLAELARLSRVTQEPNVRERERMLSHLIEAHLQVAHRLRELQGVAEEAMDEASADMLVERLRVHEKTVWMLQSEAGCSSETLSTGAEGRSA